MESRGRWGVGSGLGSRTYERLVDTRILVIPPVSKAFAGEWREREREIACVCVYVCVTECSVCVCQ